MDNRMVIRGLAVSVGRAVGPVLRMVRPPSSPGGDSSTTDPDGAVAAVARAAEAVKTDLEARSRRATGQARELLEMACVLASDPSLLRAAEKLIREHNLSAPWAVWRAAGEITAQLQAVGGAIAARATDLDDIRNRIVAQLTGRPQPGLPNSEEPFVLAACDLAPSDTAVLDPQRTLAIVTAHGGPTSHTAILARELGIPAVVDIGTERLERLSDGVLVGVDGSSGDVIVGDFDAGAFLAEAPLPLDFAGRGETSDGTPVELLANVGDAASARSAAELGAEGIGLFRTEFAFPPTANPPTVAAQQEAYQQVFECFAGRKVVVRTLDAGADKPLPYLTDHFEPNPALGIRGYRMIRDNRQVLLDQLTAISSAALLSSAEVWVMAPMVATVAEAEEFVDLAHSAGLETAGVMIEIPGAAVLAAPILARAAFASIGTNDLAQYTMAADRTLGGLSTLTDAWNPAVLHLIAATAAGGQLQDRPVGVCGEAAADPALAVVLVGLGVTSLSMGARAIPGVGRVLAATSLPECRRLAGLALAAVSAEGARKSVRSQIPILKELGL